MKINRFRRLLVSVTLLAFIHPNFSLAQDLSKPIGLEDAIGIALQNNPQLKQSNLQVEGNQLTYEQSKWQRWPSLNFSASQGFSFGRNIDPFTNQFIQQNASFNNFQLGSSVTLFNGFQLQNTVKQNALVVLASQKEYEAARNDLMVNVALVYLQILNNRELIVVAEQQLAATGQQIARMQKLVAAGAEAEAKLLDLKAQQANEELNLITAQNNYELAKLSLKQQLNLPGSTELEVQDVPLSDPSLTAYDATVNEVYETAIASLPQAQAAKLRMQVADRAIEVAKGKYLPTLSLNGAISSSYASTAPKERFISDGKPSSSVEIPSTTQFVSVNGERQYITQITNVPSGQYKHFNYFDVLDFNRNSSLNLSLRIPIFNAFQAKYAVAGAKIQRMNAEYQGQIVTNTIRKNVEEAYTSMLNAAKKYTASLNQVRAFDEAFRAAESRFMNGALSTAEYNIAKTNVERGKANLVQAKYDYVFRTKILDFYMARPLSL